MITMNMINRDILNDICEGFSAIECAKGKQKETALQFVSDNNRAAWAALYWLLNPMVTFGIGEKSLSIPKTITQDYHYSDIFNVMYDLNKRSGIDDNTIANVQQFIISCAPFERLVRDLLTKSIKLGVTAKTVNKIEPGYIPSFECMLANKYFEHPKVVEGKKFAITEKLDGIRCLAVVKTDNVKFFSRQGKLIEGLVDIEASLKQLQKDKKCDFVLDGELLVTDRDSIPSKEQYKQTTMIVRKDGEKHGVTYNVFDIIPIECFNRQECDVVYRLRREAIDRDIADKYPCVHTVPVLYSGDDVAEIHKHLNIQRNAGHEGVMINLLEAPYEFKRTNVLLKVKVMQDCDLMITGVEEGTGKFVGTLGALIVDYKGNPLGVGSGLNDEMRARIWAEPSYFIGRVATIQYFETTNDKNGKESLRFPVFKDLCPIGKEVSYN